MQSQQYSAFYKSMLSDYVQQVQDGTRIVGKLEKQAVERWVNIYSNYDFRKNELETKLKFCSLLNVKDKKGKISQLRLAAWQVFTLAHLCLYNHGTDTKVIDTVSLSFAGKNGKSMLSVVISLMMILIEDRVNCNIPIVCPTQKQANQVLDYVKQVIKQSPKITPFFKTLHSTVVYSGTNTTSKIIIVSNDPEKIQGLEITASLLDEFFLYNKQESEILSVIKSKQDTTVNPLTVVIGTFSSKDHHNYEAYYLPSINILEGIVQSDNHFILYCSQDSEKEIEDNALWSKSNPSLGVVKELDVLVKKFKEVEIYPSRRTAFFSETLNLWKEINQENPWLDRITVNNAMREDLDVPTGNNKCYIGLDLSTNIDLCSISILTEIGDTFYCKTINIMPSNERAYLKGQNELDLERLFVPDTTEFMKRNYMAYPDGRCVIRCQTPVLDLDLVYEIIIDLTNKYNVYGCYYDRYKSHQLVNRLEAKGIYCEPIQQTMTTLSEPLKYWERKMIEGKFKMCKNVCTKWQFSNIDLYELNGLIKLNKNKRRQSIDAMIATNIAITGYMIANESKLAKLLA